MSERHGYQPGVPCWIAAVHDDPEAAVGFYTELFGWEVEDVTQAGLPARYFMCKLRGRDVAAVGGPLPEGPHRRLRGAPTSGWTAPTTPWPR